MTRGLDQQIDEALAHGPIKASTSCSGNNPPTELCWLGSTWGFRGNPDDRASGIKRAAQRPDHSGKHERFRDKSMKDGLDRWEIGFYGEEAFGRIEGVTPNRNSGHNDVAGFDVKTYRRFNTRLASGVTIPELCVNQAQAERATSGQLFIMLVCVKDFFWIRGWAPREEFFQHSNLCHLAHTPAYRIPRPRRYRPRYSQVESGAIEIVDLFEAITIASDWFRFEPAGKRDT